MATYFYVASDDSRNIVTGVTRNLEGAMRMLRSGPDEKAYAARLVFARAFDSLFESLEFEKTFLSLSPRKREILISSVNPTWADWCDDLYPGLSAVAYADAVTDVLSSWDEDDDSGGIRARLPVAPLDPTRVRSAGSAKDLPENNGVNWNAVS
ncbi:MAG: hypothetical protein JST30_05260 [Armatimonadetes bacterium]|nr:hypothetical protein [Armatimonadota bacterium]